MSSTTLEHEDLQRTTFQSVVVWLLVRIAVVGGGVCAMATAMSFLGRLHWFAELFTNFPLQYAGGLAVAGVGLLLLRNPRIGWSFIGLSCLNLLFVLPVFLPSQPASTDSDSKNSTLRLVSSNVLTSNPYREDALAKLKASEADVLVLLEVNRDWVESARSLEPDFPHKFTFPQEDNFGMAAYCRIAPTRAEFFELGQWQIPALVLQFEIDSKPLTIVAAHPVPPVRASYAQERNRYLDELTVLIQDFPNVVLVGDLNLSPYSPYFRDFAGSNKLRDSRGGFGVQASWPSDSVWLRIPIDHCLVGEEIDVKNRKLLPSIGSDHFPVRIDLRF